MRIAGLVLAAGAGSRFGGRKLLAPIDGRPVLAHVLDALAAAGLAEVTVVLGTDADALEAAVPWRGERRVRNPRPEDGLASSLRTGLDALAEEPGDPPVEAAVVALGDQPALDPAVVRALLGAAGRTGRPFVRPRYADDPAPNPVLVRRTAWARVAGLSGDRGLGPLLDARPDLVEEVPVPGRNPDVDTPADLAALLAARWDARVAENRAQVERFREVPDGADFYAPVSRLFRADPERTGEPALDRLRELARPGETWLDVGAGAGRYALPLARLVREVVALDPSEGMLGSLEAQAAEHGITNVRVVRGRWPADDPAVAAAVGPLPCADTALIAHVAYDVTPITPFLDALEAAARDRCVALLMDRQPSSIADVCWPPVHGEPRTPLPALPELVELLRARGRAPRVEILERVPRRFEDPAAAATFLRRQLWIAEGSAADDRFRAAFAEVLEPVDDARGGFRLRGAPAPALGLVTWSVRADG